MNKTKFLCYRPDHTDADQSEEVFTFGDAENAVEEYCKRNFSRWEHPTEISVTVIEENGIVSECDVEVEAIPDFCVSTRRKYPEEK
jgi:hypothetical protein